jgi:two-component system, LytTR family, sensor histidine kinase AlgZ
MPDKQRSVRYWAGIGAACVVASLLANVAFGGTAVPVMKLLEGTFVSSVFSICCCFLCLIVLPRVFPSIRSSVPLPLAWVALVILLVGLAAAGSFAGTLILAAFRLVPPSKIVHVWISDALKVSIICTLIFGLFGTVIETLRSRLDAATLALRTTERDEADARRLAVEAQLASLESRVQPHFLFNTLNSIAALIPDDPAGAERMTAQLASLLRSSLDEHTPLVPLDEELRIVRNYLDIERVRFGERLRYEISADAPAALARVPRLAVQTLVENSVKYAVSPRRDGASIAVRAAASNGHVRIEVEDDGPGFDATVMPEGHGLALVRERLAMTLGEHASLEIDSRAGRTVIVINAPAPNEGGARRA